MRTILISLIFIFMIFCFSCEERGLALVNCPDCTANEPTKTSLEIKLDINEFEMTDINIYEGNLEDSILYATFRSAVSNTYAVPVNKKYTVTATYNKPTGKYITVDSAFPRVKYDKVSCQDPCYYVYDKKVNLKLKYTK